MGILDVDPAEIAPGMEGRTKIDAMTGSDWTPSSALRNQYNIAMQWASLAPMLSIDKLAKIKFIEDLRRGIGSGTYKLGDVTDGQAKRLSNQFGGKHVGNDVYMTDNSFRHILKERIRKNGYSPEEVASYAEQALRPSSHVHREIASDNKPGLFNYNQVDPVTKRRYDAVMPLELSEQGLLTVSVVPDKLPKRK